jgi:DNA gyrase subunit A
MLALVDGVPRTLTIDQFISVLGQHQIEVIQRRTRTGSQGRGARAHPARSGQGARRARRGDRADPRSADADAPAGLMELLDIDESRPGHPRHAAAPPGRPRAAEDHRRARRARAASPTYEDILATPGAQRAIVSRGAREIVDKYGDDRRTQIIPPTATCRWRT